MPSSADRVRGIEYWLLRHLEGALDGLRWIAPLECLDEFCALWSLETGRPMGSPDMRANAAGPGAEEGPAGALRAWLLAHAHRHAIDGVLWNLAQQRFADWRHRLFTRGTDGGAPPLPGQQACAGAEGAGVWLMRDVHPSSLRGDGVTEWWIGPGFFALMRVRRGGHAVLRFAAPAFLGVRWDRVRILRRRDLVELPLQRQVEEATRIVHYTADLAGLGPDEELVLYAPEDVSVLPAVPLAWDMPRRGFATQGWELA